MFKIKNISPIVFKFNLFAAGSFTKKLTFGVLFISGLMAITGIARAQEYRDPATPQAYYYDDFEYTGGSLLNWAFNSASTPRSFDLKNGSLLNGTYCLGSTVTATTPTTYYIGNKLINSTTNLQTTNTAGRPVIWEWSMLYRNTAGSNGNVTANTLALANVLGGNTFNAWKFWISSSTADPTSLTNEGYYITQNGSNIVLVGKSNSEGYKTIITSSTTIGAASYYNIKIQRTVDGTQVRWRMYITANTTDGATIDANGGGAGDFNTPITTYNRNFLESITRSYATNTIRWDDIEMYQRALTVSDNNGSGSGVLTSAQLYQGQTDAVLFSFSLQDRGITNVNNIVIQLSNSGNARFSNTRLVRSTDASYTTAGDNVTVASGFATDNTINITSFSTAVVLGTSGDKTNPLPTAYYFFLVADIPVNNNTPVPTIRFSFPGSVGSTDFNYGTLDNSSSVSSNFTYTFGRLIDWKGTNTTDWNTASNWSPNAVPTATDVVRIGVVAFTRQPNLSGTAGVAGNIQFGTVLSSTSSYPLAATNANYFNPQLTLSTNLTVAGDISSPAFSGTSDQVIEILMTSTSTISAGSLTVGVAGATSTLSNNAGLYIKLGTGNLSLSGDITLNGTPNTGTNTFGPAAVFVETGTVTCARVVTNNNNSSNSRSAFFLDLSQVFAISGASVLNVTGAVPFVASTNGSNVFVLGSATASANTTVNYSGSAAQTVFLNLPGLSGATTSNEYDNIIFSGGTTKTVNITGGTLKVSGNMSTSGTGTIADFTTNNPTITVAGTLSNTAGNTIRQGTGTMTVTGAATNAGTFTCGASPSVLNLTGAFSNTSTGTFSAGTGTINFRNNYTNAGAFTYGAGTVVFDNGSTAQSLIDNTSSGGTTFNNVTFSGSGAKTISANTTGQFYVASTGILTMGTGTVLNAGSDLTLRSDANGSAAVAVMPSGASIAGYINIERFLTGTSGGALNRGYRLMSSPVNQSNTTASASTFSLLYLNQHTYLNVPYAGVFTGGIGGTGSGFSGTSVGPTIYLYRESLAANNNSFTSGKYIGISKVTLFSGTTTSTTAGPIGSVNTTHATDAASTKTDLQIPIGNGFLMYFVGPSSRTTGSSSVIPADATITANGYLNQGNFTVHLWQNTAGVNTLSYAAPGTDATVRGFSMVGNPYASTINLASVLTNTDNPGIDAAYLLGTRTGGTNQNYVAYSATGGTSSPSTPQYVVSGGGFIVHATSGTATMNFKESHKAPTIQLKGTALIMSAPQNNITAGSKLAPVKLAAGKESIAALQQKTDAQQLTGLYLKMEKDTLAFDYCGIYFRSNYKANFGGDGDALYLSGPATTVNMASLSADGKRAAINNLPDYHSVGRIKLFINATTTGLYKLKLEGVRNIDTLYDIYLIDKLKKDSLNIRRYGTYNFNVVKTDSTTFGEKRFELSFSRKPLPQYLLSDFNGSKVTGGVKLNWLTQNESNYTGFTLEKQSAATAQFEPVYERQGNGSAAYSFVDSQPKSGNNVYRLKQNDIDGKISYSQPITIFYDKLAGSQFINVFPNPTAEVINVSIPESLSSPLYKFRVYNASGNVVMQKTSANRYWTESVSQLQTGVYIVQVEKSDGTSLGKVKFIKQ